MLENIPKVSVLMPVYNGEKYLVESIESILCQTLREFEFIIINDGSTDGTKDIIETYKDPRIRVFHRPKQGITSSLNFGIRMGKAPYISRMDADDICMPNRLEIQLAELHNSPNIAALGGRVLVIDKYGNDKGQVWSPPVSHDEIIEGIFEIRGDTFVHPTVTFRKDKVIEVGGYNENFSASQDIDLWLRLGEISQISSVPNIVLKFRQHENAISYTQRRTQLLFGFVTRLSYLQRKNGFEDISVCSNDRWDIIIRGIDNDLFRLGLYEADKFRAIFKKVIIGNSNLRENYQMLLFCFRNPKCLFGFAYRRRYFYALNALLRKHSIIT